jgi:magnesium-transporting ATPase (P-type)
LKRVLLFLAACHTIIIDHSKGTYNSASPDELALVNAAKQFGYVFKERDEHDNIIIEEVKTGALLKY